MPGQKRLITQAAALRGTSVTEFIVASALEAAGVALQSDTLSLRSEARDAFVKTILHPPPPNQALRRAARLYRQQMEI